MEIVRKNLSCFKIAFSVVVSFMDYLYYSNCTWARMRTRELFFENKISRWNEISRLLLI